MDPPWILKRSGLESSDQRMISLNSKKKMNDLYNHQIKLFRFSDFLKKILLSKILWLLGFYGLCLFSLFILFLYWFWIFRISQRKLGFFGYFQTFGILGKFFFSKVQRLLMLTKIAYNWQNKNIEKKTLAEALKAGLHSRPYHLALSI